MFTCSSSSLIKCQLCFSCLSYLSCLSRLSLLSCASFPCLYNECGGYLTVCALNAESITLNSKPQSFIFVFQNISGLKSKQLDQKFNTTCFVCCQNPQLKNDTIYLLQEFTVALSFMGISDYSCVLKYKYETPNSTSIILHHFCNFHLYGISRIQQMRWNYLLKFNYGNASKKRIHDIFH